MALDALWTVEFEVQDGSTNGGVIVLKNGPHLVETTVGTTSAASRRPARPRGLIAWSRPTVNPVS
jgi:hypothetical protein